MDTSPSLNGHPAKPTPPADSISPNAALALDEQWVQHMNTAAEASRMMKKVYGAGLRAEAALGFLRLQIDIIECAMRSMRSVAEARHLLGRVDDDDVVILPAKEGGDA